MLSCELGTDIVLNHCKFSMAFQCAMEIIQSVSFVPAKYFCTHGRITESNFNGIHNSPSVCYIHDIQYDHGVSLLVEHKVIFFTNMHQL